MKKYITIEELEILEDNLRDVHFRGVIDEDLKKKNLSIISELYDRLNNEEKKEDERKWCRSLSMVEIIELKASLRQLQENFLDFSEILDGRTFMTIQFTIDRLLETLKTKKKILKKDSLSEALKIAKALQKKHLASEETEMVNDIVELLIVATTPVAKSNNKTEVSSL